MPKYKNLQNKIIYGNGHANVVTNVTLFRFHVLAPFRFHSNHLLLCKIVTEINQSNDCNMIMVLPSLTSICIRRVSNAKSAFNTNTCGHPRATHFILQIIRCTRYWFSTCVSSYLGVRSEHFIKWHEYEEHRKSLYWVYIVHVLLWYRKGANLFINR